MDEQAVYAHQEEKGVHPLMHPHPLLPDLPSGLLPCMLLAVTARSQSVL